MAQRALKPCAVPGCPELVQSGVCARHARERAQRERQVYRDPAVQRLYNSARWQRLRRRQLAAEPWCAECLREGIYTPATDVDHVDPHRGSWEQFFSGRLQSLCHACHSAKTAGEVWHGEGGAKSFQGRGTRAAGSSDFLLYGFGDLAGEEG